MKQISLHDMQKIEIDILKYFKQLCEEHHLRYYLAYGTLLGAVRHQGFIPWDDDMDVMMPREDYNRLVEIMKEDIHPYYKLISIDTCPEFTAPLPKIIDARTRLIQKYDFIERTELGVYVDIFILDGASNDYNAAIKKYQDGFKIYKKWRRADAKLFKPGKSKVYGILRWVRNIPYKIHGITRYLHDMDNFNCQYSFYKSKYVVSFNSGVEDAEMSVYEKEMFGEDCKLKFENEDFCIPEDYDTVLKMTNGNYMEFPPESKQVSDHKYTASYKE